MPKRYADSIVYELKQKDQLKRYATALEIENVYAYGVIENLEATLIEADSLDAANTEFIELQTNEILKQRKRLKIFTTLSGVELLLLLILLL